MTRAAENLVGTTTRTVTFNDHGNTRRFPAGTEVYVRVRRSDLLLRVPGTLYTQTVYADAVTAP